MNIFSFLPFHWNTQASLGHTLAFLAKTYTVHQSPQKTLRVSQWPWWSPGGFAGASRAAGGLLCARPSWSPTLGTQRIHTTCLHPKSMPAGSLQYHNALVPLLVLQKNTWSGIFSSVSLSSQEKIKNKKIKAAVYRLHRIWWANQNFSSALPPSLDYTFSESKRRKHKVSSTRSQIGIERVPRLPQKSSKEAAEQWRHLRWLWPGGRLPADAAPATQTTRRWGTQS